MSVIDAKNRFKPIRRFKVGRHADLATASPSAIDDVKREWNKQVDSMRTGIHYEPRSYEEVITLKIKLHKWRAEGCHDSGDDVTAALETTYAVALEEALEEYNLWSL